MAPSDNAVIKVVECEEESREAGSVGGIGVPVGSKGRKIVSGWVATASATYNYSYSWKNKNTHHN